MCHDVDGLRSPRRGGKGDRGTLYVQPYRVALGGRHFGYRGAHQAFVRCCWHIEPLPVERYATPGGDNRLEACMAARQVGWRCRRVRRMVDRVSAALPSGRRRRRGGWRRGHALCTTRARMCPERGGVVGGLCCQDRSTGVSRNPRNTKGLSDTSGGIWPSLIWNNEWVRLVTPLAANFLCLSLSTRHPCLSLSTRHPSSPNSTNDNQRAHFTPLARR